VRSIKNILGKITGFVLLAGIVFGLFVVVTIPFEMVNKANAETWPSRKGVITINEGHFVPKPGLPFTHWLSQVFFPGLPELALQPPFLFRQGWFRFFTCLGFY